MREYQQSGPCPSLLFWDEHAPGTVINGRTGEKNLGAELTIKALQICCSGTCSTCQQFLDSFTEIFGHKDLPQDLTFCKYSYVFTGGCFIWKVDPRRTTNYSDHVDGLEIIVPSQITPENCHEDWYWKGAEGEEKKVKRLLGWTGQAGTYELARRWIKDCVANHPPCGEYTPSPLPDRVLDVSGGSVKLYETVNEKVPYTCLSHCWGGVKAKCTTFKSNLEAQKWDIAWDALPQTLKDAIEITRAMGVRYIWIDNLCIVQDDPNDWLVQAGKMASIYADCYFTIAATASTSDDGGCFRHATNDPVGHQIRVNVEGTSEPMDVYVRAQIQPHWQIMPNDRRSLAHDGDVGLPKPPLFTRAWCYQEMVLSPRILRFDEWEISWCCRSNECCSCGYLDGKVSYRPHPFSLGSGYIQDPCDTWYEFLGTYGELSVTFESDKLPALSAVAQRFQQKYRQQDRYVFGMWSSTLLIDMLWVNSLSPGTRVDRQREWRAPSWSWASCNHNVALNVTMRRSFLKVQAKLVELHCEPVEEAPFAKFKPEAYVVISGITSPGYLDSNEFQFTNHGGTLDDRNRKQGMRFSSIDLPLVNERIEVTAILMVKDDDENPTAREYWMVLRKTNKDDNVFERAGVLFFDPKPERDSSAFQERVVKVI